MSRTNSPGNKNIKHKGLMTSLFKQQNPSFQGNFRTTQPEYHTKVYVQTINQKPTLNAYPYMQSQYINQQSFNVNQASSQYIASTNDIYLNSNKQTNTINNMVSRYQNNEQNVNRNNYHIRFIQPEEQPRQLSQNQNQYQYTPQYNTHNQYQEPRASSKKQSTNQHVNNLSKSKFVPVPPEKFMVQNNLTYSTSPPPYQTIINQNRTVIPPNPVIQNVKKTFVPHHIYNQIPIVYQTPTHIQPPASEIHEVQSPEDQQSQQVLLAYYQKVYKKYEQQKQGNLQLMNKLSEMQDEINRLRNRTVIQPETIVQKITVQKKKRIDRDRLDKMFLQKYNIIISDVENRRKNNCLRRVGELFNDYELKIRQLSNVRIEESSYTIINTVRPS